MRISELPAANRVKIGDSSNPQNSDSIVIDSSGSVFKATVRTFMNTISLDLSNTLSSDIVDEGERNSSVLIPRIHYIPIWINNSDFRKISVQDVYNMVFRAARPISVGDGGTGATNAADARTNLGLSGLQSEVVNIAGKSESTSSPVSTEINLGPNNRGLLIFSGAGSAAQGLYIYNSTLTNGGNITLSTVSPASSITVEATSTPGQVRVTNNSTVSIFLIRIFTS